jgi:hypothetical protein
VSATRRALLQLEISMSAAGISQEGTKNVSGPFLSDSGYPADMLEQNVSFVQKPFTPGTLISRVAEILSESDAGLRIQAAGSSH